MSIKKEEYLSITYFITRAIFLGVGYSKIFDVAGNDAWISMIIGFILSIFFIFLYHKISEEINFNLDNFFSKKNKFSRVYQIIFLLTYIFLICYISLTFTNFVRLYYLYNTSIFITLLILFMVCVYGALKTEKTIIRASSILFIASIILIIINLIFLSPLVKIENFLPIYTHSSLSILKGSLIFVVCSILPHILLLEYKINLKTKLLTYSFSAFTILITNLFTASILGEYLLSTYSYPEYMVLRRITFFNFIENIENIASSVLYFDAIFLITLTFNKSKKLLKCPYKLIALAIFLLLFISYVFTNHYNLYADFIQIGLYIAFALLILTTIILYPILRINKKS